MPDVGLAVVAFWASAAVIGYTYVAYPVAVALLARLGVLREQDAGAAPLPSFTIVLAAYNEERTIERRVLELSAMIDRAGAPGELLLVSDGSTDATCERAAATGSPHLRVLALATNGGKAAALNEGCKAARGEIVVFADARQRWAPDALVALLEAFRNPDVGAVTGELMLDSGGATAGVGMYWRYEKWLRRNEARIHSSVGVSGAISAVRRELFAPIPVGTLLDDVYWPLRVAMAGSRVAYAERAVAYDRLPDAAHDEFRRKVRTLSGNFQLVARLPRALVPWSNPIWLQFLSHKVLRLLVPWALLVALVSSRIADHWFYEVAFVAQVFFYSAAALGIAGGTLSHSSLTSTPGSFVLLNVAAIVGLWIWVTGRSERAWRKVGYDAQRDRPA